MRVRVDMKVLLGTVMVLVLAVVGFYLAFVRAPSPVVVCQHIIDVTVAEAGEQAMSKDTQQTLLERMKQQCIEHKQNKLQLRGRLAYARYARCVVSSTTLRDIEAC